MSSPLRNHLENVPSIEFALYYINPSPRPKGIKPHYYGFRYFSPVCFFYHVRHAQVSGAKIDRLLRVRPGIEFWPLLVVDGVGYHFACGYFWVFHGKTMAVRAMVRWRKWWMVCEGVAFEFVYSYEWKVSGNFSWLCARYLEIIL